MENFAIEVRSDIGELWARMTGDYFTIARAAMDIMNTKKFKTEGWSITIKAVVDTDHEEIGNIQFLETEI